jgi:arginase
MVQAGVAGFWIHFDVDVLDPQVMPAVDSPAPDGLQYDELSALLGPLLRHPLAVGMNMTIYDPKRDPGGEAGKRLAEWVVTEMGSED